MSKFCGLLAIVTMLVACNSRQEPVSEADTEVRGDIEFEFVRASNEQHLFRLSNQTSQPIAFRSGEETPDGVHPLDAQLMCKSSGSDQWEEGPRPMGDSGTSNVEVPPGSEETLIVLSEPGLAEAYAGGACRVDLRLQDGSVIESGEFLP
jgi:hypothetical protein